MRKFLFSFLTLALLALVAARSLLPAPAPALETFAPGAGYNIMDLDLSLVPETAGSAIVREMNHFFLSQTPTQKNAYTGLLEGCSLVLICADNWEPDLSDKTSAPTAYRLWKEGVHFTDVYRPDWYQGPDGREFALFTGIVPTNVNGETALSHTGSQNIYFPFSLGHAFSEDGYISQISYGDLSHTAAYEALGFSRLYAADADPAVSVEQVFSSLSDDRRFLACFLWDSADCESALALLWNILSSTGRLQDTAICLLAGNTQQHRAQLFLWAKNLYGAEVSIPCSELDVVPTLLNLFALEYDSRLLSGRDAFAPTETVDSASSHTPLVVLYGSAYSDWVTDAGSYIVSGSLFWRNYGRFEDSSEISEYVNAVSRIVYDRYIYARKVMETDYFQIIIPP